VGGALDGATGDAGGALPARLTPVAFAMRGIAPVGYAVFALVLGAAVGLVLRRTVPAMAVTLALFTLVQVAVPLWVRPPHLVPPVQQTVTIPDHLHSIQLVGPGTEVRLTTTSAGHRGDWVLANETIDPAGRTATALPSWFADCIPPPRAGVAGKASIRDCLARLDDLGYRQHVVYQPAGRFWTLRWAETALFLGMSGLLAWFCFWWVRRRLT